MTKFMQKIVFFVAMITFTNAVSAHNWPIFSTNNINENHITLDVAFNEDAGYADEHYGYDVDTTSPLYALINQSINSNAMLLLTPTIEESEENEISYNIIFNGTNVGAINMTRTTLNNEEIQIRKTKHQRFREAKHQIVDGKIGDGAINLVNVATEVIVQTAEKEGKSLERRGNHWKKKYKL
ncbi:MAG: hypothetical protein Q8S31_06910 [Alphaproteobacteria bacterium]|nr:hypothetical protein [Alphaproteobacteria bacterium]